MLAVEPGSRNSNVVPAAGTTGIHGRELMRDVRCAPTHTRDSYHENLMKQIVSIKSASLSCTAERAHEVFFYRTCVILFDMCNGEEGV